MGVRGFLDNFLLLSAAGSVRFLDNMNGKDLGFHGRSEMKERMPKNIQEPELARSGSKKT